MHVSTGSILAQLITDHIKLQWIHDFRVLDSLEQKEIIHQRDGFYWLPDPDQTEHDAGDQ